MIFAPVMHRHAAFAIPRASDVALQRFLQSTLQTATPDDVQVTHEEDGTIALQLDVPGLSREQLQIQIDGKQVRLASVDGAPRQVRRNWETAHEIDASASSAKLENGVLTLRLAKRAPVDTSSQLTIE